jgi:hypothetical protein
LPARGGAEAAFPAGAEPAESPPGAGASPQAAMAAQTTIDEHSRTVRFMSVPPFWAAGRLYTPRLPAAIVKASGGRIQTAVPAPIEIRRRL